MRHEEIHLAKASGVGNQVILYGARTGGDGIGGVSVLASETFDGPTGWRGGRRSGRACRSATRSWRSCSSSAPWRSSPRSSSSASRTSAAPGCPARRPSWRSAGDGGMQVWLDRVPLRDSTLAPEEILMSESQERMMAVVEPDKVDRFLEICAQVGGRRHRRRRGHRHRPARDPVARRGRRRRPAADGGARRPGLPAALRTGPPGRTRCRPTAPRSCRGPRRATSCARRCCGWSAARTCATGRGSPTSTTATCSATPCSPSRRTPAWCASTRRPASASRSRPTATAASPSSTRTPGRSSRWPRPTATSP